jgi:hypothetical protein
MSQEQKWTLGISFTGVALAIIGSIFTVGMTTGSYNHRLSAVEKAVDESRKTWNRVEDKVDDIQGGLTELGTYLNMKEGKPFFNFKRRYSSE